MSLSSSRFDRNIQDTSSSHPDSTSSAKHHKSGSPTVRDVAKVAGVSIGTVSRYLNGKSLLPETRERVRSGIEQTGYAEVPTRRVVKDRKTLIIGAVFPSFDQFHARLLGALEKIAIKDGYHIVTCDYEGDEPKMREQISLLRSRGVDGIVCSPVHSTYVVAKDNANVDLPMVTFNNRLEHWGNDHVGVDDRDAVRKAVQYLIDMGHRRIAFLSADLEHSTGLNRYRGYVEALDVSAIRNDPDLIIGRRSMTQLQNMSQLSNLFTLSSPPTALMASNYFLGFAALRYLRDSGMRVPTDVSVISFDDTDVFDLYSPPITAIRQPVEQIASEVISILFDRIAGDFEKYPQHVVCSTDMILRESVRKIN